MNARPLRQTVAAASLLAMGADVIVLAQPSSFDGNYKGSVECENTSGVDRLRTPLAMGVRNGHVVASIPLFDFDGRTEISALVATGPVDAGGIFHLGAVVFLPDRTLHVDLAGTLSAGGGTVAGVQVFSLPAAGKATRTCEGKFIKVEMQNR
jgi:hypothetical protein